MKELNEWDVDNFDKLMDDPSFEVVDWKTNPGDMFICIDALLLPFKLEVIILDCKDDSYHFKIGRRE